MEKNKYKRINLRTLGWIDYVSTLLVGIFSGYWMVVLMKAAHFGTVFSIVWGLLFCAAVSTWIDRLARK